MDKGKLLCWGERRRGKNWGRRGRGIGRSVMGAGLRIRKKEVFFLKKIRAPQRPGYYKK